VPILFLGLGIGFDAESFVLLDISHTRMRVMCTIRYWICQRNVQPGQYVSMNELREKAKIMNVTPMCQELEGENCHIHIIKELTGA
jgi:hypothetical protein